MWLLRAVFLSVFVSAALGLTAPQLSDAQQCRVRKLTTETSQTIQGQQGWIELWDQKEAIFQCVGLAAMRFTLFPNGLHVPNFHPSPRVIFVLEGKGLLGITVPGCPETFSGQQQQQEQQQQHQQPDGDLHQKVQEIRKGDVVAVPAGTIHWIANHDNEQRQNLIFLAVNDLNHVSNKLDQTLRAFYLAGGHQGQPEQLEQEPWRNFANIIRNLDPELLAEAANVPVDIIKDIQEHDNRGFIVEAPREAWSGILRPRAHEERQGSGSGPENGLEETICAAKVHINVDRQAEADVYSREAGRIVVVDENKLPALRYLGMSAEKGKLLPGASVSPALSENGHTILQAINGDALVEAASYGGESVLNANVSVFENSMVVIPQFFPVTIRAGAGGFEWVAVRTASSPWRASLAGYASVIRAQPLDVIAKSYRVSLAVAQELKNNRGGEYTLFSPVRRH